MARGMAPADIARAVFALAITLGLVGLAAVAARRFGPEWMTRLHRPGGDRRLAIVESLTLDPQRRLVLIRLDDCERLLLLGEGRLVEERPPAAATGEGAPP